MTCHNCRIDAPKNGKHRNGLQRYRCVQCGKTFTEPHAEQHRTEDELETEGGRLEIQLLCEETGVRSTARSWACTTARLSDCWFPRASGAKPWLNTPEKNVPAKDVQADEIWTFVR